MGLFDFLKKKKNNNKYNIAQGQKWYWPLFSQYEEDVYKNIVVQQAISCIVRECKKLQPQHIIKAQGKTQAINDNLQFILNNPNSLMTTTDFIEKVIWLLYFNYNSFIIPYYNGEKLEALYPIQPIEVLFLQDGKNELYIKFRFENQLETILNYNDIIHLKYNYSTNEFMGGDDQGKPNNEALKDTLKLNEDLLKGVSKALKSSYAINGIVKYNSLIDNGKTEASLKELTTALNNNENGFLALDLKGDFTPFTKQIQLVDKDTLDFVDNQILRFFGVPNCMLVGDYTKTQYESFYQKTLEPLIIMLNQTFTKCLFSVKQREQGHSIIFNHKELEFMTTAEKIQWMTLASNVGAITINEMRNIIGFPIFEDEEFGNSPIMSKNYGDATTIKDIPSSTNKENSNE